VSDGVRRVVDVVVGAVAAVLLSPVIAVAALAVRLSMGSGVLFRQRRLGRGCEPFDLVKFRTMRHAPDGPWDPSRDHERITGVGRFLRNTSLDELPSLINLIRGDVSLVGPRPLPVQYLGRFRSHELVRFDVRPGITGLAQVRGRNTVDWDDRLALDAEYVATRTLLGDVRILLATVAVVLRRSGVDSGDGVTMHELPADRVGN
jgi:lipopolysaccharide/colanic/teichoic acid biosynthesis glycosyltransferase